MGRGIERERTRSMIAALSIYVMLGVIVILDGDYPARVE